MKFKRDCISLETANWVRRFSLLMHIHREKDELIFSTIFPVIYHAIEIHIKCCCLYKFYCFQMSKAIVLVLALVACTFAFPALEKINNIVSQDQCGIHGMETIKPRLQNKIEELRVVRFSITIEPRQC